MQISRRTVLKHSITGGIRGTLLAVALGLAALGPTFVKMLRLHLGF